MCSRRRLAGNYTCEVLFGRTTTAVTILLVGVAWTHADVDYLDYTDMCLILLQDEPVWILSTRQPLCAYAQFD